MPTRQALTRIPLNVVLPLAFLSITTFNQAQTWVITDQSHPITSPGPARNILLDQQQHLESELSRGLPADPHQAAAIIQSRLNPPLRQTFTNRSRQSPARSNRRLEPRHHQDPCHRC